MKPGDIVYWSGDWDDADDVPTDTAGVMHHVAVVVFDEKADRLRAVFLRDNHDVEGHKMWTHSLDEFFATPQEALRAAATGERKWAARCVAIAEKLERLADACEHRET